MDFHLGNFAKRKPVMYASIVGGCVIVGWVLYRHHEGESINPFAPASSSTTDTSTATGNGGGGTLVTDPVTGLTYSDTATDPMTGQTYAAEIQTYGSVPAADQAVSGTANAVDAQGNALPTGYYSNVGTSGLTTTSGQNLYQSNSAWSQAVQAGLEDVSGTTAYDGTDIGTALGAFLQGEPLTTGQAQVISVAEAEFGMPPQGNLQVVLQPTNVQTAPEPPPPPAPKAGQATKYAAPSGLTAKKTASKTAQVSWNLIKATSTVVAPASYTVAVFGSKGNQVDYQTVSTPDTSTGKGNCVIHTPNTGTYSVECWANGGKEAPPHSTVKVTV